MINLKVISMVGMAVAGVAAAVDMIRTEIGYQKTLKEFREIPDGDVDIADDSGVIDRAHANGVPSSADPVHEIENDPTEEESENVESVQEG